MLMRPHIKRELALLKLWRSPAKNSLTHPAPGNVFATLLHNKAGGGTRQRKRKAGGTPGGVSPCKKMKVKVISPYWEQSVSINLTEENVKYN